ncbi:MAG: hypothetical protein V1853_02420 [bacterium]
MRIYFYGPKTDTEQLQEAYAMIRRFLKQSEVSLSTNTQSTAASLDSEVTELAEDQATNPLEMMEGIIIEGSTPDPEVGYLLAYALAQKKPILFLTEKSSQGRQILKYLKDKQIPKVCQIRYYTHKTLQWLLDEFIESIGHRETREIPRIKFTLRITPTIEAYLDWKTQNIKLKKADFLRGQIDKLISHDKKFQAYLKRKRKHNSEN